MRLIGHGVDGVPIYEDIKELNPEDVAGLVNLTGSLGASMLQGRGGGGSVLNLLGAGLGSVTGLGAAQVLNNGNASKGVRFGSAIGGAALGHLITNYLTDLFLETPRERELRIKGLEYAVQQQAAQQQNGGMS